MEVTRNGLYWPSGINQLKPNKMKKFECEELEKVVQLCKDNNIECYAFQRDRPISQIFMVDNSGRIGTVSARYGGLSYATVHKPCKKAGTGFGLSGFNGYEKADILRINQTFINRPEWASQYSVEKYKGWEEYANNRILKYYKL